jgi:hypothetical protein
MTGELALRWFPAAVALLQLIILPLLIIALNSQIDSRIRSHNLDLYAHPSLNDLKKLEEKIEDLSVAVKLLEVTIARLTPRRSHDPGFSLSNEVNP